MRRFSSRRGLLILCAAVIGVASAAVWGAVLLYPHAGAWMLRNRVLPRAAGRFDRTIEVGPITVQRGRAVLEGIVVSGARDADDAPLASIDRVVVTFDFWPSLIGDLRLFTVDVEGARVAALRNADGSDNFRDIARKLGMRRSATSSADGSADEAANTRPAGGALGGLRPDLITVTDASLSLRDLAGGITVEVKDVDTAVKPGLPVDVAMADISVTTTVGPSARAETVRVRVDMTDVLGTSVIEVKNATIAAHRAVSLSSIAGHIRSQEPPGRLGIEFTGSYGGATEPLWKATGWVEPGAGRGSIHLGAERFTFDRLDSILRDSVVVDYQNTAIGAELDINVSKGQLGFVGTFELSDANIFHPMMADKPMTDIDVAGKVRGNLAVDSRVLTLDAVDVRMRGVDYRLNGWVRAPGGIDPETGERRVHTHLAGHLVIPPIECQKMLEGIPAAMATYMQGYELEGEFGADIRTEINWADLQATALDGIVDIFECEAVEEPEDDTGVLRFLDSFTHYVEVAVDEWIDFEVGEENPDFVPVWDVSQHLLNSFMTTEDTDFYEHQGFITREFRTALIKNLEAGYFRYGASSITMQTVKNVLLYREKTLSRKLQELFLTWHLENRLEKDRIFEIYVNAIEYGPRLYGIGAAARHFFGKHPRDLNPVEAVFFSSILPSPKLRYKQYCNDRLSRWTRNKIGRILKKMHERKRLTDEEYELAQDTELVFDRAEALPQRECRRMLKRAIENDRPTNPMLKTSTLEPSSTDRNKGKRKDKRGKTSARNRKK